MKGGKEAEKTSLPEDPKCKGAFSSVSSLCGYDEATGSGDTPCGGSVPHAQIPARVTRHTRQGHADTDQGREAGDPQGRGCILVFMRETGQCTQTGSTGITSADPEGCSLLLVAT